MARRLVAALALAVMLATVPVAAKAPPKGPPAITEAIAYVQCNKILAIVFVNAAGETRLILSGDPLAGDAVPAFRALDPSKTTVLVAPCGLES